MQGRSAKRKKYGIVTFGA